LKREWEGQKVNERALSERNRPTFSPQADRYMNAGKKAYTNPGT
jgi:hypothetical protein